MTGSNMGIEKGWLGKVDHPGSKGNVRKCKEHC